MLGPKKTLILQRRSVAVSSISASGGTKWYDVGPLTGVLINKATKEIENVDKPTAF